jgi:hypothetical protein
MAKFKYWYTGKMVTHRNYINEKENRLIRGMIATIQFRMFYVPVSCLKYKD